jgi:hypothetical protein
VAFNVGPPLKKTCKSGGIAAAAQRAGEASLMAVGAWERIDEKIAAPKTAQRVVEASPVAGDTMASPGSDK